MATAKPRRHRLRNTLIVLLLLATALAALLWHRLQAQAMVATAYGARVACTCHYVEGRPLNDCRKDFEPGMGLVRLNDNAPQRAITARVPLVASQSASFREGAGCLLQSWTS